MTVEECKEKFNNYYFPYLSFVEHYMEMAKEAVHKDNTRTDLHNNINKDILLILKQCSDKCTDEDVERIILKEEIE